MKEFKNDNYDERNILYTDNLTIEETVNKILNKED